MYKNPKTRFYNLITLRERFFSKFLLRVGSEASLTPMYLTNNHKQLLILQQNIDFHLVTR